MELKQKMRRLKFADKNGRVIVIATAALAILVLTAAVIYLNKQKNSRLTVPNIPIEIVRLFPFSEKNSLKEWEEKIFKGKVVYRVEQEKDLSYVRATSTASASALYYKIKLDAKNKKPVVAWKWRAEKFPEKRSTETLTTQDEDDFAARVYVIFPALFFTNSKVLEYVWAQSLPVGMTGASPYSKNIKLIVLETGADKGKEWVSEERDIAEDYKKVFGRTPEYDIGAVAFMTNAEHTGTSADAMYDDIKLGYK